VFNVRDVYLNAGLLTVLFGDGPRRFERFHAAQYAAQRLSSR
jgi:hypothetical protein